MSNKNQDLYHILGISRDASDDEIKKALRQLARKFHPDNKETGNEEKFKEINFAYEILSDAQKKATYDRYGVEGLRGSYSSADFGFNDLSDIFAEFFGASTGRRRGGPERGADLRYDLEIEFLDVISGVEKEISINTFEDCGICKGSGARPGSKLKTCKTCEGAGEVRRITESFFGHVTQIATCPTCGGSGNIVEQKCDECLGVGQKKINKNIDIKIPCGIDDGARLRLTGKGEPGKKGGPPGDLYVIISIKEHDFFDRDGLNIITAENISFSLAALGGNINVRTTDGEKKLTIPSGLQSGAVLKIPGLGIPKLNNPARRGDHLIEVIVQTPTKLSQEEKKLFEELMKYDSEKTENKEKKFKLF